jgi:hypothetical protein
MMEREGAHYVYMLVDACCCSYDTALDWMGLVIAVDVGIEFNHKLN